MKTIFFLDLDTQRDLMLPSGALCVPGAERLIPKLRRLFDFARKHEIFVMSLVHAHLRDGPKCESFPPHCIAKTEGQRKIEETLLSRHLTIENKLWDRNLPGVIKQRQQVIIERQTFDLFDNPVAEKLLRILPRHAIVFGVPMDHSVRRACLTLRRMNIKTAVVGDATRPLDPMARGAVMEEVGRAGVEFITTENLLGISSV
jgi:nicotinamidase-related amidase